MLGSFILYLKAIRIVMFQLSGFYYTEFSSSSAEPRILVVGAPMSSVTLKLFFRFNLAAADLRVAGCITCG